MKILTAAASEPRSLGRFLRSEMGLSQHMIASLKPQNRILVNGEPQHTNYFLHPGDCVTVLPEEESAVAEPFCGPVPIVYEDDDMLIIDKPAPLPTMSSPRQSADTLENRMAYLFPHMPFRPVNRLDKGTSGLMIAAKHANAQYKLSSLLHSDRFVREYLAIVEGVPGPSCGRIDAPIRKADGATVRREVHPDGLPCATQYQLLSSQNGLSLLRLRLETGRTHQIRVHMAHLGHPVYGDFLYGTESASLAGRFALHSHRILLSLPDREQPLEVISPLPEALRALL